MMLDRDDSDLDCRMDEDFAIEIGLGRVESEGISSISNCLVMIVEMAFSGSSMRSLAFFRV